MRVHSIEDAAKPKLGSRPKYGDCSGLMRLPIIKTRPPLGSRPRRPSRTCAIEATPARALHPPSCAHTRRAGRPVSNIVPGRVCVPDRWRLGGQKQPRLYRHRGSCGLLLCANEGLCSHSWGLVGLPARSHVGWAWRSKDDETS